MKPKVIKNQSDYEAALARIDEIFDAAPGTAEGDELELLSLLVERYEAAAFPIGLPDPLTAIRFRMEQQGLKPKDLAPYLGSASKVSEVLSGRRGLSLTMIRKLATGLGIPAEVLLREPGATLDSVCVELGADKFPIAEMVKRGWFPGFQGTVGEARENLEDLMCRLLPGTGGNALIPAFNRQYVRSKKKVDPHALRAWHLRVASLALREELPPFEAARVTDSLLRDLVQLSYLDAGPRLARELLQKIGIHVVVERHLPGTYLDGAALRLPSGAPLIALTLRHDRLDNFWFTLAHELGHVVKHLCRDDILAFYDDLDNEDADAMEREADAFARDTLVSQDTWKKAGLRQRPTREAVRQFAEQLRVDPAIPAGRIRYEKHNYTLFSDLVGYKKVRCHFDV
ncbi:MAG: ImmA/IrrE family metallo-endopeptidase [FCB group bacterium]|jgi:HTH-type transcriptional regulator/antitoxin HigA|nr:ImmA/IrrE family metallo-endopeptidase [FCB group bacterium]